MTDQPPSGSSAPQSGDDSVTQFRTIASGMRGRVVRLGPALDTILQRHNLPDFAADALGQTLTLSALIGAVLPEGARLNLHVKTDGQVPMLTSDYEARGGLRGAARVAERSSDGPAAGAQAPAGPAVGTGQMAITVETASEPVQRYQSVVALDGGALSAAVADYFLQQEGLPTVLHLAVGRAHTGWRAGGLLLQNFRPAPDGGVEDEDWTRVRLLAETVTPGELMDTALSTERLLIRLFHEEGVTVEDTLHLKPFCRCSREKVRSVLKSFPKADLEDLRTAGGTLVASCDFCGQRYSFSMSELEDGAQP